MFPIVQEEAFLLLSDFHSSSSEMRSPLFASRKLASMHVLLAQKRTAAILDLMESVVQATNGGKYDDLEDRLANIVSLVSDKTNTDQVFISCWESPRLVFDVVIGQPALFDSTSAAMTSSTDFSASAITLPIQLKARAVYQVFASSKSDEGDKEEDQKLRRCRVNILRCSHTAVSFSSGRNILGDVTVQLSIRPVVEASGEGGASSSSRLSVCQARLFQTNAMPPRPHSSMDIYTSSRSGDEEVKVTLRFQTKRSLHDQPPNLLVDLVVKPEV